MSEDLENWRSTILRHYSLVFSDTALLYENVIIFCSIPLDYKEVNEKRKSVFTSLIENPFTRRH